MNDLQEQIIEMVSQMLQRGEEIPPDLQEIVTEILTDSIAHLERPQQPNFNPQMPEGTELLYVLSGGDPRAFESYLRTIPDPTLNQIGRNTGQTQNLFNRLHERITIPHGEVEDGIPKAPLQSSNIYGYAYSPRDSRMLVRFNSGAVYRYDHVPAAAFKAFQRMGVPAKTTGSNQYGQWWRGKRPSSGASFYELIRDRFPYQRVA